MNTPNGPILRLLEVVGCCMGIAGALVLSMKIVGFEYAWLALSAASISTTAFAFLIRAWGLMVQQLFFTGANLIGAWTWLIEPSLRSGGYVS